MVCLFRVPMWSSCLAPTSSSGSTLTQPRVPSKHCPCTSLKWCTTSKWYSQNSSGMWVCYELATVTARSSVLARNEEFSKIAVINFFLVLKKKKNYLWGGFCGEIFLSHANQKFNTCLLTCRQTRKIYEHSHRPVCQYIAPCVIIAWNVIAIDKYTYNMLFIFCYNPLEVHEWYCF